VAHLGSWKDQQGHFHDLTNPEAEVQPIIDGLAEAKTRAEQAENVLAQEKAAREGILKAWQDNRKFFESQLAEAKAGARNWKRVARREGQAAIAENTLMLEERIAKEQAQARLAVLEAENARLRETLHEVRLRMIYVGHPAEPM